jgi:hypothetical protein
MAQSPCYTCTGACTCGCGVPFTSLNPQTYQNSLIAALTGVADTVRDIATQLGARPYTVTLVWVQWSGGQRDIGNPQIAGEYQLLPTPLVSSLNALTEDAQSLGLIESGKIRISEMSPRFSEDLLFGRDVVVPPGQPLPPNFEFYWAVTFLPSGIVRRFFPTSAPSLNATNFEWSIDLVRSYDDPPRGSVP